MARRIEEGLKLRIDTLAKKSLPYITVPGESDYSRTFSALYIELEYTPGKIPSTNLLVYILPSHFMKIPISLLLAPTKIETRNNVSRNFRV